MRRTKRLGGSGGVWRSSYIYCPGGLGGSGSRGIRAGSHGSGGRGFGGSGSLTGPGSFFSGGSAIVAPCRSPVRCGHTRFDQFLDEPHRYWFRERQPDGPLRHFVSLEAGRQLAPDRAGHRKQAAVVLERGVPDERAAAKLESGDSITERLLSARGDGANGGPNLLEGCACFRRRRSEVGTHLWDHFWPVEVMMPGILPLESLRP